MIIYHTNQSLANSIPKYLSEKLNMNILVFETRYIEEMPKNDSGKTLYSKLEIQ